MRKQSSNSVKVVFADKNKVIRQVKEYSRKLKRAFPEVEKVGLFGSYATDVFGPASDVDLLIILRASSKRFLDRIPDYIPDNLTVSCDVFPYTSEEIAKMKQDGSLWISRIFNEAVWL
jgi:predicted nucleotidyltransferase